MTDSGFNDFERAKLNKFLKGQEEHKQNWMEVDHVSELKDELLDMYNYSSALYEKTGDDFFQVLMVFSKFSWEKLNEV